jgi:hypothetical protein
MLRGLLVVLALFMPVACGGSTVAPAASVGGTFTSSHFLFRYTALDGPSISDIAASLEREYSRILTDLAVDAMPTVTVTLYTDHAVLEAATRAAAGVLPPSASGLVTSSTEIHLMSPNAPAWGPYSRMLSNLVHEFAHCVSMRVNPRIPNNPRWLWESVAIYESGQSVDLRGLSYMTTLQPPSFASMATLDNPRVYEVGYSIAEFVVSRWGRRALIDLVAANGDTAAVGLPQAQFEQDWFAFARQHYGF